MTSPDDVLRARSLAPTLHEVDPARASALTDPTTQITLLSTPFFRRAEVFFVLDHPLGVPAAFTLGHAADWATVCLDENPDGWAQLAESGVDLSTPELRVAYVFAFLETTRTFNTRFRIVREPTEVGALEGLTPAQTADLLRARARIVPPLLSITEIEPWIVRVYALKGYDLHRVHVKLDSQGIVESTYELLQENLPLPLVI